MPAEEWDACGDPHRLLEALRLSLPREPRGGGSIIRPPERKLRLLAVAVGEGLRWLFKHEWHRMALDATEEVADDKGREGEVRVALRQLHEDMKRPGHPDNPHLDQFVWCAALPHEFWEATGGMLYACHRALETAWGNRKPPVPDRADLFREVFANPFRSVAFDPAWRTSDVMLLSRGIYDEKAFDRMPILADALQDAGCASDELLNHLRDPHAAHVRGCWALDLVLGKE
jgi:hypothetical protein